MRCLLPCPCSIRDALGERITTLEQDTRVTTLLATARDYVQFKEKVRPLGRYGRVAGLWSLSQICNRGHRGLVPGLLPPGHGSTLPSQRR